MDTSAEPSADTSADGRWVSYAELAAIRGIDHHSARRLTARQRWRRQKDNHGVVRVLVPSEHLRPERRARDMSADTPAGMSTDASVVASADVSADISAAIKSLEGALTTLREQLTVSNARAEQAEVRAAQAEQMVVQERGRADALRDRLETELQRAQKDTEGLRLAIDELKAGRDDQLWWPPYVSSSVGPGSQEHREAATILALKPSKALRAISRATYGPASSGPVAPPLNRQTTP
jgi:hypothetical protein